MKLIRSTIFATLIPLLNSAIAAPIWQIEKDGHRAYIVASFHRAKAGQLVFQDSFVNAIKSSTNIYFETNSTPFRHPEIAQSKAERKPYTFLSDKALDYVSRCYEALGTPPERWHSTKAWVWYSDCENSVLDETGEIRDFGVEAYITKAIGNISSVKLSGIESIDEQLSALDHVPEKVMLQAVESDARSNLITERTRENHQTEAFNSGTLDALEAATTETWYTNQTDAVIARYLLEQRTVKFYRFIEEKMKVDSLPVFVVGLYHFPRKTGLLELLKINGYHIVQIK